MAVAAETKQITPFIPSAPHFPLAEAARAETLLPWIDADTVPELRTVRLASNGVAAQILEQRMQQLRDGEFHMVPDLVERMTDAHRAAKAKRHYGTHSVQYRQARESVIVGEERAITEALRKLTYEYFPELEQTYDPKTGGYTFMGRQLTEMVDDGLTPAAPREELQYRIHDRAEERIYSGIRQLGRLAVGDTVVFQPARPIPESWHHQMPAVREVRVLSILECSDWALEAYEQGRKSDFGGMVPEIKKLMIRGVRFGMQKDSRFMEQVGLPGMHYTPDVVIEAMVALGVVKPGQQLSKEERHAKKMINMNGQGVLYVAKLLDTIASKKSGKNIFMGEVVQDDHPKDYSVIPMEAVARHNEVRDESEQLADFMIDLSERGEEPGIAQNLAKAHEHHLVFSIAKRDPEWARVAFDAKTARKVKEAARREEVGDLAGANRLYLEAEREAPPLSNCASGDGTCGIWALDLNSSEGVRASSMFDLESGDTLLLDSIRACTECKQVGGVVYAIGKDGKYKGKGCLHCDREKKLT